MLDGKKTIQEIVEEITEQIVKRGFGAVCEGGTIPGNLALPRKQEIYAAFDRYRGLRL